MKPEQKKRLVSGCSRILEELLAGCVGLLWASVSTKDGIEIARAGELANESLSVMSGTMHALADGIVAEAALGACYDIILNSEGGRVVILSVRDGDDQLVLAGIGRPEMTIGMLLSCCTAACAEIGQLGIRRRRDQAPQPSGALGSGD